MGSNSNLRLLFYFCLLRRLVILRESRTRTGTEISLNGFRIFDFSSMAFGSSLLRRRVEDLSITLEYFQRQSSNDHSNANAALQY